MYVRFVVVCVCWACGLVCVACRSVLPAALVLLLLYFAMTWATRGPGDVIEPGNLAGLPSAPGSSWGFTCWWGRGGDAPLALLLLFECNMMLTCIMASIYCKGSGESLQGKGREWRRVFQQTGRHHKHCRGSYAFGGMRGVPTCCLVHELISRCILVCLPDLGRCLQVTVLLPD